ncbi:pyridoxamine 5'-phosphate oxidase [Phenylobacterium sp.]|jgi:pyridoxamine 5'-phosphate oxidase|uniref:pyridoxamine 5'-phosphate oxidase n=1 Tax=Phenylobacterium sp. TaxID=1871053 RepID=UPI002E323299|nr:pyridoxamine 5'-phosphate oxidase [Phenylobacterium sp.]HEX4711061.1 pyridoxamine 5'-phosphate oxidase [Phenylobacterium sp.]
MTEKTLIPPTPTEDDYVRQVATAEALPLLSEADPFALFNAWLAEALAKEPNDANAMSLATVDENGLPDVRMVLLKDADARGFVFYTNLESAKGRELAANPKAALLFHWKSLRRQVRVRGSVTPVSDAEADAYWATRARPAQLGAWASAQSRPLPDRLALEKKIAEFGLKFGLGKVPRPPHWSGFRVEPETIEFWRDRPFRLHERLVFARVAEGWTTRRLFP